MITFIDRNNLPGVLFEVLSHDEILLKEFAEVDQKKSLLIFV